MAESEPESGNLGGMKILQHFSHHHPLVFITQQDHQSSAGTTNYYCSGCDRIILEKEEEDGGWGYYECKQCKYYVHKECGELELASQIDHPFHPKHLLSLLPKSPYKGRFSCNFCHRGSSGFVYHCDVCNFDLHVNCALLQSSIAPNDLPISLHHDHPLFFLPNHNNQVRHNCSVCDKPLSGPIYHCSDCPFPSSFNLHTECAELKLAPQIDHPFHPQHLLTLSPKSQGLHSCKLCHKFCSGFVYLCDVCKFNLHVSCASLQSSVAPNFPISLHGHPMILVQNHMDQLKSDCNACHKPLYGPIYLCSICSYKSDFGIHKECCELPLEINHPYDRNHPLTLLPNPPSHPERCSCDLCKTLWKGFVYSCSLCNFDLTPEDVNAPRTITNPTHPHPWTLISRQMSFICDFCGTTGDRTPYLCATCDLLVHKNCILLPRKISITRHQHIISHSYSLRRDELEERICKICYKEVNTRYGCYHCLHTDCNYIAHALCATDKPIWDGTIIPEDFDESSMEPDSSNLITDIFEEMCIQEQMVAVEIKHAFHDHNLRLTSSGEIKDDDYSQCDGCMRSISTPFYRCNQCKFFIHKDCAELPREKRHPFHKHSLTLMDLKKDFYGFCCVCWRYHHGFRYRCDNKGCKSYFECDIRCIHLSDTLEHPSHEHSLFLVHNRPTKCSGCFGRKPFNDIAYRCMKHCDFTLDMNCATEPLTVRFKYDKHPLTLTYSDDSSPSQHFCDLCEEGRDPKNWFYHCANCDNSLHSNCALEGELQFMKLGINNYYRPQHRHPFTIVKNIWNCPPCKECSNVCNGLALECEECNFTVHRDCLMDLKK